MTGGGSDDSAIAPSGGNDQGASPRRGISALLTPLGGNSIRSCPRVSWMKGDSTYDIDSRST
jgi:hypothetical protein